MASKKNNPFRSRRVRFMGLDSQSAIKGFFALASGVAILILLSIVGALLKEGYDFVPSNHHHITVMRKTGGEFNQYVRNDIRSYEMLNNSLSVANARERQNYYSAEQGRQLVVLNGANSFEDVVEKRRDRLENDLDAGRVQSAKELRADIRNVGGKWLEGDQLESALENSNRTLQAFDFMPYLEDSLLSYELSEQQIALLSELEGAERGLNRFVWLRDDSARDVLMGREEVRQQQQQQQEEQDSTREQELSGLALIQAQARAEEEQQQQQDEATGEQEQQDSAVESGLPEGAFALEDMLLIDATRIDELMGETYFSTQDQLVWVWLGAVNKPVAEDASLEGGVDEAQMWVWSDQEGMESALADAGFDGADEMGMREVLKSALRNWSTEPRASKPPLYEGVAGDSSYGLRGAGLQMESSYALLDELADSNELIEDLEMVMRLHILVTYAASKQVDLAPDSMIAYLEGAETSINRSLREETSNLNVAYQNSDSAAGIELYPVAYAERIKLVENLREGMEVEDREMMKQALMELALVSPRDGGEGLEEGDLGRLPRAIDSLLDSWEEYGDGDTLSVERIYAITLERMQELEARMLVDFEVLEARYEELLEREDLAAVYEEMGDTPVSGSMNMEQTVEAFGEALAAEKRQRASELASAIKVGLDTLDEGESYDLEAIVRAAMRAAPLAEYQSEQALAENEDLGRFYEEYVTNLEESPQQQMKSWSYDEPVSWLYSLSAFFAGTSWATGNEWFDAFGLLPLFTGSLMIALIAIMVCVPFAVGAAIFVNQFASKPEMNFIKPAIEFIEALPSIVLGFFGIVFLSGFLKDLSLSPMFNNAFFDWFGFPIESRLNAFVAGILLGLMAIPTVFTLSEDAINNVPGSLTQASVSLGASKVQTVFRVILPTSISGVIAAILLGFGRVIGETMVVLLVAGGAARAMPDLMQGFGVVFEETHTMTGIIAQEIPETAPGSEHWAALFMIGIVLFFVSLLINAFARWVVNKFKPSL